MGKHSQKHNRSLSSYRRRALGKQPKACILIVCEGEETEPIYFNSLRKQLKLSTVEVEIEGEGKDSIKIVKKAIKKKNQQKRANKKEGIPDYDQVWCVIDTENPIDNPNFVPAINLAQNKNISLAVSNPAFEYWYLLHFKDTDSPFLNATEVIKQLSTYIENYKKNIDYYLLLSPNQDKAIERAERVLKLHSNKNNKYPNPSTTVHQLVNSLIDLAK